MHSVSAKVSKFNLSTAGFENKRIVMLADALEKITPAPKKPRFFGPFQASISEPAESLPRSGGNAQVVQKFSTKFSTAHARLSEPCI